MPSHTKSERSKNTSHVGPSPTKARKILRDGRVRGVALTRKQRGFLGARAGRRGR